jgi:membrane protein implicated in regulation of membrane protease activity
MLWIILAIVFLAVEFGTVALISLWFVGGSVAALAVCLLGGPL